MSEKRTRKSWTTTIYTDLFIGLKELSETTKIVPELFIWYLSY